MSMVVLTMALVYNVIFGFIRNPAETDNTLSWLGYDYPHGFLMWGVLTAAAFFLNIIYLYKKFGYPGRVGTAFAIAAIFFMPGVVFINDWGRGADGASDCHADLHCAQFYRDTDVFYT